MADPVVIEVPKGGYVPSFRHYDTVRSTRRRIGTPLRLAVVGATLAVALAAAAFLWVRPARPPVTIAVLPLENLTTEPGSDYFADGLTDEIIRNLSVIEGLAVRSRTSSFALKGRPRDVRELGRQLDADYLVEGSVLRTSGRLRVHAQLVRVQDDVPLWSGKYDRALTDVFAVQDEISVGIVNNLRLRLGHGRRRYESSVQAYDHYLRASVWTVPSAQPLQEPTPTDNPPVRLERSIEAFERAVAADPMFAPAHAGLASAYAVRSVQFVHSHPDDELTRMRASAARALELDPLLPEAHAAAGLAHARDAEWEQAEASFRRAIALDPNRSTTYKDYAHWVLAVLGRHTEAVEELQRALRADPLSADVRLTLAIVLVSAGRYDEAADHCRQLRVASECLARVRAGQRRFTEVAALLTERPAGLMNPQTRGFLGYAYARSGRLDDAEALLRASTYANEQALILAGLGDRDQTFEALDRMAALGPQRVGLYLHYPEMALLHGDPRLDALRIKVGLPASSPARRD
jgi:TolB-like protein